MQRCIKNSVFELVKFPTEVSTEKICKYIQGLKQLRIYYNYNRMQSSQTNLSHCN